MLPNNECKKSCTSLDGGNPVNNGIKQLSTGAGCFSIHCNQLDQTCRVLYSVFSVIHVLHFPVVVLVFCCLGSFMFDWCLGLVFIGLVFIGLVFCLCTLVLGLLFGFVVC